MTETQCLLTKFLRDYLDWVEDGAPDDRFDKSNGLCDNLNDWARENVETVGARSHLRQLLRGLFIRADLDLEYPFDGGQRGNYLLAASTGTQHLNHKRIAFCRNSITELIAS
ncbi:hypothetical protein HOR51_gp09 [Ralstonia phage phiAp1]|uniref:Uncharacterized protein n=1 Tax=Ralstonia phage phiAp1 TaxID=2783867 RepID=A0A1L7DS40_9CAUD|nr:hypothetical protein HOR51_gp09 [Ralstonia phage phiAp1]APU03150.1 hypothetical protein phiAp1_09 [Ralstonia phage phiAp1]